MEGIEQGCGRSANGAIKAGFVIEKGVAIPRRGPGAGVSKYPFGSWRFVFCRRGDRSASGQRCGSEGSEGRHSLCGP